MARSDEDRWFPFGTGSGSAPHRLFCLPFAGGGASNFLAWRKQAAGVDIAPLQYPGHETRWEEPFAGDLPRLVEDLAAALSPWLDRPYDLLGYSMGARIAFALAHRLAARRLPAPRLLMVAAHPPPDAPPPILSLASLPDQQFRDYVETYGGLPQEILGDASLLREALSALRADFALAEQPVELAPLACPIVAYAGRDDPSATPQVMAGWQRFTRAGFTLRDFPGGHFFLRSAGAFVPTVVEDLHCLG